MDLQNMLGKVGLTTRGELDQAQAKKEIWHSLVRDVFARYYLKMREVLPDQLPNLPRKYSAGWEDHIKAELNNFLSTDLKDVDPLLRACGFGTEKWQQFVEETLPEMDTIVEAHLNGGSSNGDMPATDEEMEQELRKARKEIRQLRSAGRRALDQLRDYEQQLNALRDESNGETSQGGDGESFIALFPSYADEDDKDDKDDKDDYQTDQPPADDALESNGNPSALFSDLSEPADDAAATEFFADDEGETTAINEPPTRLFTADTTATTDFADDEEEAAAANEQQAHLAGDTTPTAELPTDDDWTELQRQNQELRAKLALRDKKVEALNNQLEDLEEDFRLVPRAERLNTGEEDDLRADGQGNNQELMQLQLRNNHLQRDLNAKDQTITVLRERVGVMERQIGAARDQLLAEVKQLKALTSGKLELKPIEELDQMEADDLLEYAQNVAGDIDVRRQTLDEGLKGVSTLQDNYEESRQQYEKQQLEMEEQFEKMAADLEEYQEKMAEAEAEAEAAVKIAEEAQAAGQTVTQDQGEAAEHLKVVATQRDQLLLLSQRIKELQNSNKDLQGSNHKMYKDLDTAVKRLIPLRNQIEELENLREALASYIRTKYDRTFTIRKMQEQT